MARGANDDEKDKPLRVPSDYDGGLSIIIRDGRLEQVVPMSERDRDIKADITIRLKPLDQYPGDTPEDKAKAELHDLAKQQEQALKKNPDAKVIDIYLSKEAHKLIVDTLNDRSLETRQEQATAFNKLVGMPANERSERGGSERSGGSDRGTSERSERGTPEKDKPNTLRNSRPELDQRERGGIYGRSG